MLNLALKGQNPAWLETEALYVVGRPCSIRFRLPPS